MASLQQDSSPLYFSPKGLSDALDSTDGMPGAMASLQNLIFDPAADNVLQCRPAAVPLLQAKFPNPILSFGFVSVFKIVGDVLYGMVASRADPGNDQPFAFNLLTNTVIPVTGFTAANTPASPPTSGPWTPPTMDVVGVYVVVTHPGFASGTFATATDTITFAANPTAGDTLTFGSQQTDQAAGLLGTLVTFVASAPIAADGQVLIGVDLAHTLANLLAFLQTSGDANLGALTYSVAGDVLSVAYVQPGVDGNSYPIASSSGNAVVATPTLTGGSGCHFGAIDISAPLAPTWSAGNCAINPLPAIPNAVAQFNSRAYFLVNPSTGLPGLIPSDPLLPFQRTNGSYVLTFGDNTPLTALAGLPLQNQLGGIVQSLIVFKGIANMEQVTGDPLPNTAAGAWASNTLNVATGTLAPRSVVPTPQGLMFMSPQGYRTINFFAQVSPPIGADGKGVSTPFIYCPNPSRVAAASNAKLLRVSVPTQSGLNQEFWLDIARQIWTGPHTLPANMIEAYKNTFIEAPVELPNSLWQSDWFQSPGSVFSEAGLQLQWAWQTSLLPDAKTMQQYELHESILKFSCGGNSTANAVDEGGDVIADANGNGQAVATIPPSGNSSGWAGAQWAGSLFYGQAYSLSPVQLQWPTTVVFSRLSLQITGASDSYTRIGALQLGYEALGYLPQPGN